MKIRISHPTGNANVRSVVDGLYEANMLESFHTTVASFDGDMLDRLSDFKLLKDFKRRKYDNRFQSLSKSYPLYELLRIFSSKLGLKSLTKHETGIFSIDNVCHQLDKQVAKSLSLGDVDAVYAYEDNALETFEAAKRKNITCIYDLPIGYWRTARKLLEQEKERHPAWEKTITGLKDSPAKLDRKDKELALADFILVASQFTAKTLQDYPGKLAPVKIIPYGFPPVLEKRVYGNINQRKLKLLYVGGLSQRKGIADVFEVARRLEKYVELTVVGRKPIDDCDILNKSLQQVTWIPSLPHNQILQQMREHDVLLFPSLFEGFGLVITEAMSQGTPVITTGHTVGPDFIRHGENGWIIQAGSTEALENTISDILRNASVIKKCGQMAQETASLRPWKVYAQETANEVLNLFS